MPADLSGFRNRFRQRLKLCPHCGRKHDEAENAVGGCPLRPLEPECTAAPDDRPTLRCRLFGCKPIDDGTLEHQEPIPCECPAGLVYNVHDGTDWGRNIHVGGCIRCRRTIMPRATAQTRQR